MIRKFSLLATMAAVLISLNLSAQGAQISFTKTKHDFGEIAERGGRVNYTFEFKNTGQAPLVIQRVAASCGCTSPDWTKTPVEPGKTGYVKVSFNPVGQAPNFTKSISVYSNASDEMVRLYITGKIVKEEAGPKVSAANYPISMGDLKLNVKSLHFDNINKGEKQTRHISVMNDSKSTMNLDLTNVPAYFEVSAPSTLRAGQKASLSVTFDASKISEWGPVNSVIYPVINGTKQLTPDFAINIAANVLEDYSKMSAAQKRQAPILEVKSYNLYLGNIKKGSKVRGTFQVKNAGSQNLEVRRVVNNNREIGIKPTSGNVKGGGKTNFRIEIDSKNLPVGEYKKTFSLQTNDPLKQVVNFTVNYKVI